MLSVRRSIPLLAVPLLLACSPTTARAGDAARPSKHSKEELKRYWFSGKAEINRYRLEQARYGEIHQGDAVLLFVTESFLPQRQVKAERPESVRGGAWPVLKLNATKSFLTGIYPYSMMTSVFTPVDVEAHPATLKTTTSVQEWCGHTWLQLNLRDGRYQTQQNSYFEAEGDGTGTLRAALLEDEIWNRIRLAPDSLPTGEIELIPGAQQSRLRHRELGVERAVAGLRSVEDGKARVYTVRYPDSGRTLSIRFAARFPYEILGWEETYRSGFGAGAKTLTTKATRTHVVRNAYWQHNGNADRKLRASLGLSR